MAEALLYDYWRSSASYRVRIALGLKGVTWQAHPIDLLTQAQRDPQHLERNPQGLVPVIEIDGVVQTQSLAIIEYLDESRPLPPLLPFDPQERARVRALAYVIAMEIHPLCNSGFMAHVEDLRGGGQDANADWMRRFIPAGLAAFEALLDHPCTAAFCHGQTPGLADICLIPQLYNARRWDIDLDAYPRILEIERACAGVPAFQAAYPDTVRSPA